MVSFVPAFHTPKATLRQPLLRAAPSGCPSELWASLLHREVDAGECHQIPLLGHSGAGPDGSQPRPSQCLPSATQNSLTWCRISSRAQSSGVQRPGPLGSIWITIKGTSGPELPLGSTQSPAAVTVQLLLPAAFTASQVRLLRPLAAYLLSADLYLRVQRTWPKTAALSKLLQPAARDP